MAELDGRIEVMYRRDKLWAWALVLLLWITILAVLIFSWPYIPDNGVRIAVLAGAAAVLLFNTASIAAMLNHYAEDKEFIYGLDIKGLDAMKAARK
jgi:polyferredoxin